jgi:hypothetical protein
MVTMIDISMRVSLTEDGRAELVELKRSAPLSPQQFNQVVEQARIGVHHDEQARQRA